MDDKRVAEIDARWVKADLVLHVMTSDERQALSDIAYLLDALTTAQARIAELQALVETLSGYEWQTAKKLVDAVMSTTPPESKP